MVPCTIARSPSGVRRPWASHSKAKGTASADAPFHEQSKFTGARSLGGQGRPERENVLAQPLYGRHQML